MDNFAQPIDRFGDSLNQRDPNFDQDAGNLMMDGNDLVDPRQQRSSNKKRNMRA